MATACRDPAREQAGTSARDHAKLEALVGADAQLDRALKSADDASRTGDDAKAGAILEGEATRAADGAIAEAERAPLETPWARARRDALLAVMRGRRAAIPAYAAAVRGDDLEAKLTAVQGQLLLQKRAMEAATAALGEPGP